MIRRSFMREEQEEEEEEEEELLVVIVIHLVNSVIKSRLLTQQ